MRLLGLVNVSEDFVIGAAPMVVEKRGHVARQSYYVTNDGRPYGDGASISPVGPGFATRRERTTPAGQRCKHKM